jgi:peptide/nickel transport system ATP-binding protein
MTTTMPLLQVRNLSKHFTSVTGGIFRGRSVEVLKAVDNVNCDIMPGETLGIVGESGSGKTTAARCILRAIDPTNGSVLFRNNGTSVDLAKLPPRALKPLRK